MRYSLISLSILGVLVVGCEQKKEAPATPTAASPKVEVSVPAASADAATPAATVTLPATPATPAIADAAKSAEAQSAAATTKPTAADAQTKLDLVTQYIKDKKYDLADKLLSELEANKASLPSSIQGQIPTVRAALTTAKAGAGASETIGAVKMPSLGK